MADIDPKIAGDFINVLNELAKSIADLKSPTNDFVRELDGASAVSKKVVASLKDQELLLKKQKSAIVDIKSAWEKVGGAIKDPSKAMNGAISKMSEWSGKGVKSLRELSLSTVNLKDMWEKFKSTLGDVRSVASGLFLAGSGLLVGGVILALGAFTQMWSFLDKKVLPATADFNRQIGNMGQSTAGLKNETISAGVQFEMLGKTFAEGAANARDFAAGMMLVGKPTRKELKETIQTGLKLTQVVGLSAEQSGKMALFFEKSEGSLGGLNDVMDQASVVAHKYQVPVNQIRKDLGEDLNLLARFGTRNRQVMLESAAKARTYGLSLKEINGSFGEQMDSFDKTSDVAAKLNSVFGTHINSYQLMLETDPTKRMEMLRKELNKQGKSWDTLNVFEQNVIASTTGMSKENLALGLSSEDVRKKLQKQADQQAHANKINKDWDKGLLNVKQTLLALQPKLDLILRSVADFISELFGFGPAGSVVTSTANSVGSALDGITSAIQNATKEINIYKDTWDSIFQPEDSARADKMIDLINKKNKSAADLLELQKGLQESDVQAIAMRRLQQYEGKSKLQAENTISKFSNTYSKEKIESRENASVKRVQNKTNIMQAKDALVTKTGQVIKFNPDDNILATKSPISRSGQGATATAGKGAGSSEQTINIMPAPIYLDGAKIAEAIFRRTRR